MNDCVAELRQIGKVYGTGDTAVVALDDLSLQVQRGEYLAVMGTSGSGKSTAMNIIGCLDRPSSGSYHLNGTAVQDLSGGQQQRVAVARAIINQPGLLLADEPTGALDSRTTEEVLDLFGELHHQGMTILIVTHEQEVADRASRLVQFHDGRLLSDSANP